MEKIFKDVAVSDNLYLLSIEDKTGLPSISLATVKQIVESPNANPLDYMNIIYPSTDFVLGLENEDGTNSEIKVEKLNKNSDYTVAGKYKIATSKERLSNEIKNLYDTNIKHVRNADKYKAVSDKASEILSSIGYLGDTGKTEERLGTIEGTISDMKSSVDSVMAMLTKMNNTKKKEDKNV